MTYLEKIQINKTNKLEGLHPLTKFWVVLMYSICCFIFDSIKLTSHNLSLLLIPWFLVVVILCAASGQPKKCAKAFQKVLLVVGLIFVVQTFIVPGGELIWCGTS